MFEESVSITIPSIWASMNSWFTPAVLFVLLNLMIGTIAITSTLANQKQHHNHQHQQNSQNDLHPQQPKLARSPSIHDSSSIANHFKTIPDSDTHYGFERTHQPQSLGESHSEYIFEQAHQPQNVGESHSQYIFEHTRQEKPALFVERVQENQTHYFFQQSHEENEQGTGTHFVFQQTHEENAEENGSRFHFEQGHEENGNPLDFEQTNEDEVEDEEVQTLDEVYSQLKGRGHVGRSKPDTKPIAGDVPARLPTKMKKSASMESAFKHLKEEDIVEARRPATVRETGTKSTEGDDGFDAKCDVFINKFKEQLMLQTMGSIVGTRR
nr:pathogen-associated molecular patterns-induced protein A70-like [Coffea arabica]